MKKLTDPDFFLDINMAASESAKTVLRAINKLAKSENATQKQSVIKMNVFCVSPTPELANEYASILERTIVENKVLDIKGKETYLAIDFPVSEEDKEVRKFFMAPKKTAAITNEFHGVFMMSFRQFDSYSQLKSHEYYDALLDYVEKNNSTTMFVFHVPSKFDGKKQLFNDFQSIVNTKYIEIENADYDRIVKFALVELYKKKIKVAPSNVDLFSDLIFRKIDITSGNYKGYSTVERFIEAIAFEVFLTGNVNGGTINLSKDMIRHLDDLTDFELTKSSQKIKLGFM